MSEGPKKKTTRWGRVLSRLQRGAANAATLLKEGRLGAPYRAPFEVLLEEETFRLRHYAGDAEAHAGPLLFVPPLMVTSEVYDISPELSAVTWLRSQGVDVWLVDFGKPELEDGGLTRTLDDHILAVDACVDHVHQLTGEPVHLAGYSQGGMFVYQAAAYRRSAQLASLITFGSPVDMRRNMPVKVHEGLAGRLLQVARVATAGPLEKLDALPGALTAGGFKVLSPRKEIQQLVSFFGLLHDREALERREPRRRFLGGEGFVAWPGPAFRSFVDEMVVHNRMASGGFVVGGRTVTLADITCPILIFVGSRDDFARPPSVRAITQASPEADVYEDTIRAGHFGLVVGSRAMTDVWPRVRAWLDWARGARDDDAFLSPEQRRAERADARAARAAERDAAEADGPPGVTGLYDLATDLMDGLWRRLGDVSLEAASVMDALRWQLPRLARLKSMHDHSRVNIGRALQEQAEAIPDEVFFLWSGRAFTYAEANRRVNQVLHGLVVCGIHPGDHVGVLMHNHPDVLTLVSAVSRLGAVSVMLNAGARGRSLEQALEAGRVTHLVADPAHAETARAAWSGRDLFVMGADREAEPRIPHDAVDLDTFIDPDVTEPPNDLNPNPGRAEETAMLLFTSGTTGLPKAAVITNRRWALAALATAAACKLTPTDTVYCCLPLYHATGMLVAVGGALIGGCRLALAPRFSAEAFWPEVRRYGATVVFYVGELCRYLVSAPEQEGESEHPVRLFVGNGMRADVWRRLLERFGPAHVIEFYAATEGNIALANLGGHKIGSVGQAVAGVGEVALVRYDIAEGRFERGEDGHLIRCEPDEIGVLIGRIGDDHPLTRFEGYASAEDTERKTLRDVFAAGDAWFHSGDLLRQDADGDFWFVDRLGETYRWKGENVSTEQVQQVLAELPGVRVAVAYGVEVPGEEGRAGMAALQVEAPEDFDGAAAFALVSAHLSPAARPRYLRLVDDLETTASFKFVKRHLVEEGYDPRRVSDPLFSLDASVGAYVPLDT